MVDPTLDHYELFIPNKIQDQEKEEDKKNIINLIIRSTRERVIIPKNKQKLFSIIQFLLGDDSDNVYEIQNVTEAISLLNSEMENIAIKYLSEHFLDLIESDKMNNLNEDIIFAIIDEYASKENEKIKKDDDEFKKIFSIIKDQEDEGIVIHFILSVKIEYTGEIMNELFEYLSEHLNDEIVSNELPRITLFIKNIFENKGKVTRQKGQIIECKFNGDLSGIVSYLKNKIGNDLEKNDALKLSGGGSPNQKHPITNLIQYDKQNIDKFYYNWQIDKPSSESDSWIEFDFCERKINLTSYTIRTYVDASNCKWKPKTWRIVGSNDHKNWTVLNRQVNCSKLNGEFKQHNFECEKNNGFYRYIRYIQEDSWNSSDCKYSFSLTCIEMFGSILEK